MKVQCMIITVLIAIGLLSFEVFATTENIEAVSLRGNLPLALRYNIGDTLYYRLRRHSEFYSMDGTKSGEHKAFALFSRTRIENTREGKVRELFRWERFGVGQSVVADQPAELTYLEEAEGFALTCSVQDETLLEKLDFSALPRTIEGMWFMIMSWDAVTFDGAVRAQKYFSFPDAAPIGTIVRETRGEYEFPFEYAPLVTDSKYVFSGNGRAEIIGVTLVGGTPCAIVEFEQSGNRVQMNMDFDPVRLKTNGFEHFWGKTYLSLDDGRIVRGELVAPVVHIQDMQMGAPQNNQHHEFLIIQRLEMDLLSREEFDSELAQTAEQ